MNKLRKKIFWTLQIILSLFLLSILFLFHYQNYNREKGNIEQNLGRMNNGLNLEPKNKESVPKFENEDSWKEIINTKNPKRFIDAKIYTILLDESNQIVDVISHTEDGLVKENIEEIAKKILIKNNKNTTYIGNLYFNDFSYQYIQNHHITLIDTHDVKARLLSSLEITIVLFLLAELIIVLLSKKLSEWIIKPVEKSFYKQKQFIADASHELKTPLSVIMACAETLKVEKKEQKWLDHIKTEAEQMSKLICNLLELAKVENENKSIKKNVDLSKVVEKAILPFESLAYEKSIPLEYTLNESIYFECNSDEIRELVTILLDNAMQHSVQKGKIIVNLKQEKNTILLEVINKGKPIPKGEEEKIFERFYRVDKSRNRNLNRYGLGLAIASSIVTNHEGVIKAFSANGFTTFQILFKKKNIKSNF